MVNKKNNPPACSPHQPHLSAEDFPSLQSKDTLPELIYKRYLNIKHNDPNMKMTDLNPFDVERKLKTVLGKRHTCKVSTTRSGLLLIEVDRKEIVDKLLKTTKIGDIPVTISENVILNSSKGIVYCDNEEVKKMTDDQIKKEIENQNVTHVYRIKKRTGPQTHEPSNLFIITFGSPILPNHVKIGYINAEVRVYYPNPRRCFNCQRYGHGKTYCSHDLVCPKCGEEGHEYKDCQNEKRCYHCRQDHETSSRECPMFKLEKLIIEENIDFGVGFKEARTRIYHRHPELTKQIPRIKVKNQTSYKTVVAQSSLTDDFLKEFQEQQKLIKNQQETIALLTQKIGILTEIIDKEKILETNEMDISEQASYFRLKKRLHRCNSSDTDSDDIIFKSRRASEKSSASNRQEAPSVPDTKKPQLPDQGASSHGLEDKNKPAPSPAAAVSKEVRESPQVSAGDKGTHDSFTTSVDKESSPEDDRRLDDQSKGGGNDNVPPSVRSSRSRQKGKKSTRSSSPASRVGSVSSSRSGSVQRRKSRSPIIPPIC